MTCTPQTNQTAKYNKHANTHLNRYPTCKVSVSMLILHTFRVPAAKEKGIVAFLNIVALLHMAKVQQCILSVDGFKQK